MLRMLVSTTFVKPEFEGYGKAHVNSIIGYIFSLSECFFLLVINIFL